MEEYSEFSMGAGLVNTCTYKIAVLAADCEEIRDNRCDDTSGASGWDAMIYFYILEPAGTLDERGNHKFTMPLANGASMEQAHWQFRYGACKVSSVGNACDSYVINVAKTVEKTHKSPAYLRSAGQID
jgi:hypothetical protein